MRAQRRKIDLQTARIKAELIPRAQISEVWCRLVANFKARSLAIPSKLAGRIRGQHDTAVIHEQIEAEILEALAELASEGNIERLVAELEELPGPGDGGDEDGDASAETDGVGVVGRKPKTKPRVKRGAGPVADEPS